MGIWYRAGTVAVSEVELAEVKQMDTLMYPFLKNSGFF